MSARLAPASLSVRSARRGVGGCGVGLGRPGCGVGEVDCALGTWGAEVSSVEGVSADVVVFEVGLSVQAGGITTIGGLGRRVAGVSGAYGRKTPR